MWHCHVSMFVAVQSVVLRRHYRGIERETWQCHVSTPEIFFHDTTDRYNPLPRARIERLSSMANLCSHDAAPCFYL